MPELLTTRAEVLGLYQLNAGPNEANATSALDDGQQSNRSMRLALFIQDDPGALHIITADQHTVQPAETIGHHKAGARRVHVSDRDRTLIDTALGRSIDPRKAVRRIQKRRRDTLPGGPNGS